MTLAAVHSYLDKIDTSSYQYWCSQSKSPTAAQAQAFFENMGFCLPADFCEFTTSRLDGLHIEVREDVWPRRKGGKHWWFLYGISVFGLGSDIPDWLDLRHQYELFKSNAASDQDLLPFMRVVSDADRYCFTREGEVVHWNHETRTAKVVDEVFSVCLLRELLELEQRKARVVSEGFV